MTNHYEYLQEMCDRFPQLFGVECSVFDNKVRVKMTDGKGLSIIYKEMTVEGVFENKAQVEDIKSRCAYDIICHLCLKSHADIKEKMRTAVINQSAQLN